jgi:nucleoside phosphorylase
MGEPAREDLVVAAPLRVEAAALRLGDPRLRVVRTGMGRPRAEAAAARLRADPAGAIAIAGVCGALDPALVPGDVFLADALLAPDGTLVRRLDVELLREALASLGIASHRGALSGSERLLLGAAGRERIGASGARAVDMESVWLAPGVGARPLAVLRVVSDGAGHEVWRPTIVRDGLRALARLRDAAPALARWSAAVAAARGDAQRAAG